jgi:hypothetical protein
MDDSRFTAYSSQVLAGCSAAGAIFADGQVTGLRIGLATVAALASVTALLVTMKSAREQKLLERKIDLLTEGGVLPYSLEQDVNGQVDAVAKDLGLKPERLERFESINCFFYRNSAGEQGLLALRQGDLRKLWLEPRHGASRMIRQWLEQGFDPDDMSDIAREVVFAAVSSATVDPRSNAYDPMRIQAKSGEHGAVRYNFSFPQSGRPAYSISFNVSDWERGPFAACMTLGRLFNRVRSEVLSNGPTKTGATGTLA